MKGQETDVNFVEDIYVLWIFILVVQQIHIPTYQIIQQRYKPIDTANELCNKWCT